MFVTTNRTSPDLVIEISFDKRSKDRWMDWLQVTIASSHSSNHQARTPENCLRTTTFMWICDRKNDRIKIKFEVFRNLDRHS